MKEVRTVITQIKPPKHDFPGQVAHGAYTIDDDVVTLTDRAGNPVQDERGRLYTYKLPPGYTAGDAENAAGRLTRAFRLALQGKPPENPERVSRPINYPKRGWM